MPAGRPTDYRPEYCHLLIQFFNRAAYRIEKKTITLKNGTVIEEPFEMPNDLPTLAGFCWQIGITRMTLMRWRDNHKEFSDALDFAKEMQEHIFSTNVLKGLYTGPGAVLVAKNLLDWRDKTEVQHQHNVAGSITHRTEPTDPKQALLDMLKAGADAVAKLPGRPANEPIDVTPERVEDDERRQA